MNGIVADARANGVLWISAAGNYARRHWSGSFTDADGDDVHDFAPNNGTNTIVVGAGQQACVYLKWDDWPLSDQDFDLFCTARRRRDGREPTNDQKTTTAPPTETSCYTNAFGTTETSASRSTDSTRPRRRGST